MATNVKAIPEGFHSVTPHLVIKDCGKAIDFYKAAFGAEELFRMPGPSGKVMHAEIRIGNSILMMADEFPEMESCKSPQSLNGTTVTLNIYSENVDAAFDRALNAGAQVEMPPADMFWGDRYGKLRDPFGHSWSIATHLKDLTPEEIGKAAAQAFGG